MPILNSERLSCIEWLDKSSGRGYIPVVGSIDKFLSALIFLWASSLAAEPGQASSLCEVELRKKADIRSPGAQEVHINALEKNESWILRSLERQKPNMILWDQESWQIRNADTPRGMTSQATTKELSDGRRIVCADLKKRVQQDIVATAKALTDLSALAKYYPEYSYPDQIFPHIKKLESIRSNPYVELPQKELAQQSLKSALTLFIALSQAAQKKPDEYIVSLLLKLPDGEASVIVDAAADQSAAIAKKRQLNRERINGIKNNVDTLGAQFAPNAPQQQATSCVKLRQEYEEYQVLGWCASTNFSAKNECQKVIEQMKAARCP